jgi:hypothetical protein
MALFDGLLLWVWFDEPPPSIIKLLDAKLLQDDEFASFWFLVEVSLSSADWDTIFGSNGILLDVIFYIFASIRFFYDDLLPPNIDLW